VLPATLPPGFVQAAIVEGLTAPTAMELAPDGRFFVAEQRGTVRLVKGGQLVPTPVVTVPADSREERGLVGLTLDPRFETNGYLYVYYTVLGAPSHNRVSRFQVRGDVADPGSERVLLDLEPLPADRFIHNGGALHFGTDGMLYVGVGDNGNPANAQDFNHFGGKVLRITPDGAIPPDNPFRALTTGAHQAIWALGLRNPFTFAFQPGTGRMYINDVGLSTAEEIDLGRPGANYGWPQHEGPAGIPGLDDPVHAYPHQDGLGGACAISGGTFFAGPNVPPGFSPDDYFFADLCGAWIRKLDSRTGVATAFASDLHFWVADLDTDAAGNLYYMTWWPENAGIYRIAYNPTSPPVLEPVAPERTVSIGDSVTFEIEASGPSALRYQWQRDGQDIPGATGRSYTLPAARSADSGARFRVVVSNEFGRTISPETTLRVVGGGPPQVSLVVPVDASTYNPGLPIALSARAFDPEDGELPASALTWQIDHHHDEHVHPLVAPTSGRRELTFDPPTAALDPGVHWFRVTVTAVDSTGLVATVSRDFVDSRLVPTGKAVGRFTAAGITVRGGRATLRGLAAPGTVVEILVRDASGAVHPMGRVAADKRGRWQMRARRLARGTYQVLATSTDRSGVAGPPQPLWSVGGGRLIIAK
jgi:glucose/arabinose dehydrogenase